MKGTWLSDRGRRGPDLLPWLKSSSSRKPQPTNVRSPEPGHPGGALTPSRKGCGAQEGGGMGDAVRTLVSLQLGSLWGQGQGWGFLRDSQTLTFHPDHPRSLPSQAQASPLTPGPRASLAPGLGWLTAPREAPGCITLVAVSGKDRAPGRTALRGPPGPRAPRPGCVGTHPAAQWGQNRRISRAARCPSPQSCSRGVRLAFLLFASQPLPHKEV